MTVVYEPERRHYCGPNEYGYWMDFDDGVGRIGRSVPGTVRECRECSRSWVAYQDERDPGYMGVKWRREGRWERRRRLKRQQRESA